VRRSNGVAADLGVDMNAFRPMLETLATGQYRQEGPGAGMVVFYLILTVLMVASYWKLFVKGGKPGWASIVPLYNVVVFLQMVNRPVWWIVLLFIPIVNLIVAIVLVNDLAASFGKGVGWTILLLFLGIVFVPVLAFGNDRYVGRPARTDP
jgi:hypothetical protein